MSHEVRNPLVAISTFAQLLPERYEDEEFREQFSVLVAQEIGRLNGMIEQINTFANPPDLSFGPLRVEHVLSKAVSAAVRRNPVPSVRIERTIEPGLPDLWGDEHALVECFSHLITNAIEAVDETESPAIILRVGGTGRDDPPTILSITVRDNGRGLPQGISDRAFSPFYTTKARGIGLGLPIARRTVTDHGGDIQIDSSESGTAVVVSLPVRVTQKESDEARLGSG
jgi:nitrogen-specific signal transduction histidine kinase